MRTVAIVPSAGTGRRLALKVKKPFVSLRGKPIIARTLAALESSSSIDGIILACDKRSLGRFRRLISKYGFKKVIDIVIGGKTRYESVRNCLGSAKAKSDIILIHDGARPFVDDALIKRSVDAACKYGACVAALQETDTVKLAGDNMRVINTLDRRNIYRAQTPQAFRYEVIVKAYRNKRSAGVTDDASLVEMAGIPVRIVEGMPGNIKITTKEDLKIAEVML